VFALSRSCRRDKPGFFQSSSLKAMSMKSYVLTVTCPSTRGIVAAISGFLADKGCYIIDSSQFDDMETGLFFMRVTFTSQEGATFEEIIEAGKAIKKANPKMKGFALQAYGWLFEELLANQGALLMNNNNGRTGTPTEIGFKEEEGKSVFRWVEQMVKDGTFANYGTNGDNMIAGFLAGDVAMFLQSSANARNVIDNAPFEVGIAFLPHPANKERQGVIIGGASLWMIAGKPEAEQKAAWEFMKYLQTPEVQAKWHIGTGYFAVNPAAYEEETVKEAYEKMPQLKVTVDQLQTTKPSYATQGALMDMIPEGRRIIESALETVFNGGDVDQTYDTMVKQLNDAIQQANAARKK